MKKIISIKKCSPITIGAIISIVFLVFVIFYYSQIANFFFSNKIEKNGELLKLLLSFYGGVFVLWGLHISNKRAKTTEESVKKQGEQIELSRKSQIDERFKNAIEHIGSDKEPVILGGVAELHQIAIENKKDYALVVHNILCSYIRSEANIKKSANDINSTVIKTIINYVFKLNLEKESPYKGLNTDLSFSNLSDADLTNCDFTGADLSFCRLDNITDSILDNVKLTQSDISGIYFKNNSVKDADFFRTRFKVIEIENIYFENIKDMKLGTTLFINCQIKDCNFNNSNLSGTVFMGSSLENVSFNKSSLSKVDFSLTNLINIDFTKSESISMVDFRASGFKNVFIKQYISECNFNGCGGEDKTLPLERLSSRLNQKANLEFVDYDVSLFNKCKMDVLSQIDCDEIQKKYKQYSDPLYLNLK